MRHSRDAPDGTPHVAVIYNPVKTPLDRVREAVEQHEHALGWAPSRWYQTARADAGLDAVHRALEGDPAVILVAGGDGTVRAVVDAMQGAAVPIALLPTGTGNLLARSLGISLADVEANVSAAFTGTLRAVDVGVVEFTDTTRADAPVRQHTFLVMAGIGLDAEMAERTSALAKRRFGWLAYSVPIARSIIANRLFHLDYRIDGGRTHSTRAHTVIVGNCGTLTGNALLIPAAVIDDGLLDVVMMRPQGRFGWARIGTRLTLQGIARRSRHSRNLLERAPVLHALAYVQGRRFEARFETAHLIELDGDSFGHVTRASVTVRPGALQVRVP